MRYFEDKAVDPPRKKNKLGKVIKVAKVTEAGNNLLASYKLNPPVDDEGVKSFKILNAASTGRYDTTDSLITYLEDSDSDFPDYVWEEQIEEMETQGLLYCPPVYGSDDGDEYGLQEFNRSGVTVVEHSDACSKCGTGGAISDFGICVKCMGEKTEGLKLDNVDFSIEGSFDTGFQDL